MVKYRIHWRAGASGATGHGTGSFPRAEAQGYADAMNRDEQEKYSPEERISRWVEPVEGNQDEGHTSQTPED